MKKVTENKISKSERRWWSKELMLVAIETTLEWGHISADARRFVDFVLARDAVRVARGAGKQPPWSPDPILQAFAFCNVAREDDRVTQWIAANWRAPHKTDPDLWFALVIARRCVNLPAVLSEIGYPVPWNPDRYLAGLGERKRAGKPCFNSDAYKLDLNGQSGDLAERQVNLLLNPLWAARNDFRPRAKETLSTFHARLAGVPFMDGFYAAQVLADLKYIQPLKSAPDWWDFAVSRPGSLHGLDRATGHALRPSSWDEESWIRLLHPLRGAIAPELSKAGLPRMHAQDMEHCLAEFDKYERIRSGKDKGRKFIPNSEPFPLPGE